MGRRNRDATVARACVAEVLWRAAGGTNVLLFVGARVEAGAD